MSARVLEVEQLVIMKGARLAVVYADDKKRTHGLGNVGEPLAPYLGDRAADYSIALPADCRDLRIYEVDYRAKPTASGRYPRTRVGWDALAAPDFPSALSASEAK